MRNNVVAKISQLLSSRYTTMVYNTRGSPTRTLTLRAAWLKHRAPVGPGANFSLYS